MGHPDLYRYALCHILKEKPKVANAVFKEMYDGIDELFRSDCETLRSIGFQDSIIAQMKSPETLELAREHLEWYAANGIEIIDSRSPRYPSLLLEIDDRPPLLMRKGRDIPDYSRCISIVGTRHATPYGCAACRTIVRKLAQLDPKPIIVSGLACGIDSVAHQTAMESGLTTIGISGAGPEKVYPPSNKALYRSVAENGALFWEFGRDTLGQPYHFLQRNRIIAGMSLATIVIESDIKGGSMNTAALAFSYNRAVYALPGRVNDTYSTGCNLLIERKTAEIIQSSEGLINAINWSNSDKKSYLCKDKDFRNLYEDPDLLKILEALKESGSLDIFELRDLTGISLKDLTAHLLHLMQDSTVIADFKNEYSLSEL